MPKLLNKTAISIGLGFVPFILLGISSAAGRSDLGFALGLAWSAILVAVRFRRGNPKTIEVVFVAWFALMTLAHLVNWTWVVAHAAALLFSGLAAMAWGGLALGRPFTIDFAKDDWSEGVWQDQRFLTLNRCITAGWAIVFLYSAVAFAIGLPGWSVACAIIAAKLFSIFGPERIVGRAIAHKIAKAAPYDWPMPRPDQSNEEESDIIVVGSGIGGLSAAALLAKESGLRVKVLEQHTRPGGCCHSWTRNVLHQGRRLTFHFDAGVHDISGAHPGGTVDILLDRLNLRDRIHWLRMTHEYRFPNRRLRIPQSADEFIDQLGREFPAEADNVRTLFSTVQGVLDGMYAHAARTGGVPRPPRTVEETLEYTEQHPQVVRWMERPFRELLDNFIVDPELKHILCTLTVYLTDQPDKLSVGVMAPIFGYYFHGGYYPEGGSQRLADLLVETLQEHGGSIAYRSDVQRILVEKGSVAGVELTDGTAHRAPIVLCNADLKRTVTQLLDPDILPPGFLQEFGGLEQSTSAFMVQLGIDFVPDAAPLTFCRGDSGLGLGIAIPSLADPSRAPEGYANIELFSLIPASQAEEWDRDAPEYAQRKKAFGDRLVAEAEQSIPGLSAHIVFREDSSPATFGHFIQAEGGALYGPAWGTRAPMKMPVQGLLLAGSGVFPGPGIEAVAISGVLAAEEILSAVSSVAFRR